eukprot:1182147-Prorocentrum_minimum.AAC.1
MCRCGRQLAGGRMRVIRALVCSCLRMVGALVGVQGGQPRGGRVWAPEGAAVAVGQHDVVPVVHHRVLLEVTGEVAEPLAVLAEVEAHACRL